MDTPIQSNRDRRMTPLGGGREPSNDEAAARRSLPDVGSDSLGVGMAYTTLVPEKRKLWTLYDVGGAQTSSNEAVSSQDEPDGQEPQRDNEVEMAEFDATSRQPRQSSSEQDAASLYELLKNLHPDLYDKVAAAALPAGRAERATERTQSTARQTASEDEQATEMAAYYLGNGETASGAPCMPPVAKPTMFSAKRFDPCLTALELLDIVRDEEQPAFPLPEKPIKGAAKDGEKETSNKDKPAGVVGEETSAPRPPEQAAGNEQPKPAKRAKLTGKVAAVATDPARAGPEDQAAPSTSAASRAQEKKGSARRPAPNDAYSIPSIGGVKPFIYKLRWLVSNPAEVGDVVSWASDGSTILVRVGGNTTKFKSVLLRTYGHETGRNFYRQLVAYGFTDIKDVGKVKTLIPAGSAVAEWRAYYDKRHIFIRGSMEQIRDLKALVPIKSEQKAKDAEHQLQQSMNAPSDMDAPDVQQPMPTGMSYNPYAAHEQAQMEEYMRQQQLLELQRQQEQQQQTMFAQQQQQQQQAAMQAQYRQQQAYEQYMQQPHMMYMQQQQQPIQGQPTGFSANNEFAVGPGSAV